MVRHAHALGLLAVILAATLVGQATAAMLLYEPFDYTAGLGLAGQPGQAGVAGNAPPAATPHGQVAPNGNSWMTTAYTGFTPYASANDAVTSATDLSYSNLIHQPSGSVTLGGMGTTPRLAHTPINNAVDGSSVHAYYSMALRIDDISGTHVSGGLIAGFNNTRGSQASNPATVGAALYAKASGGGFVLGVLEQGTDAAQATYDTTVLSLGSTYFVVGRYTINGTVNLGGGSPTTDDTAQIWINPTSLGGVEPGGALVAVNNRADIPTNVTDGNRTVQSFYLRQSQSAASTLATNSAVTSLVIDELRIGTTYADVTPVPEPGGVVLAMLGAAGIAAVRRRRW